MSAPWQFAMWAGGASLWLGLLAGLKPGLMRMFAVAFCAFSLLMALWWLRTDDTVAPVPASAPAGVTL